MDEKPIGYRLKQSAHLFNETVKKIIDKKGISQTYFYILSYLIRHPEMAITQKDICSFLNMKPSTISITLHNMEQEGLIERRKDIVDSRKMLIVITKEGFNISEEYKRVYKQADKVLLNAITNDELNELYKILNKINQAMESELK